MCDKHHRVMWDVPTRDEKGNDTSRRVHELRINIFFSLVTHHDLRMSPRRRILNSWTHRDLEHPQISKLEWDRMGSRRSSSALPQHPPSLAHRDEVAMLVEGVRPDATISAPVSRRESCNGSPLGSRTSQSLCNTFYVLATMKSWQALATRGPTRKDARSETDLLACAHAGIDTVQEHA